MATKLPVTDYDVLARQPEEMSVGQLNFVVRDLRERLYQKTLENQELRDQAHAGHGRGNPETGPDESDCPCRTGPRRQDCAASGCGFCRAASKDDTRPVVREIEHG